ncbi:MAG: hypothetical protein KO464_03125 [Candidatus Methanofastidiosum sp.]|nr:hypothetical protein [Methanofastidiosum sp.]
MISETNLRKLSEFLMAVGLFVTVFAFMGFNILPYMGIEYVPSHLLGLFLLFFGIFLHPEIIFNLKKPKIIVFLCILVVIYAVLVLRFFQYMSRLV